MHARRRVNLAQARLNFSPTSRRVLEFLQVSQVMALSLVFILSRARFLRQSFQVLGAGSIFMRFAICRGQYLRNLSRGIVVAGVLCHLLVSVFSMVASVSPIWLRVSCRFIHGGRSSPPWLACFHMLSAGLVGWHPVETCTACIARAVAKLLRGGHGFALLFDIFENFRRFLTISRRS